MRLLRNNTWDGVPPGGFKVTQGGTIGLKGILESSKDVTSGILVLDENSQVKPGDIPFNFLNYTPMLEGPQSNFIGVPFTYQITNFGFNRDYDLEFTTGEISRDHDIITVSPAFAGDHVFKVNGREFLITVFSGTVARPVVESVFEVATVNGGNTTYSLTARASAYFSSGVGGDTHVSSFWQVATDPNFVDVIASTTVTSGDLRNATLQTITQRPVVYVRVRYIGSILGNSSWSAAFRLANGGVQEGLNAGDQYGYSVDTSDSAEKIIIGSPGFGTAEEPGSGLVSILRNTGNGYSEELSVSSGNQAASVQMVIPTGGSVRVLLDSTPVFDQTYATSGTVNIPSWALLGKLFGRGGPGTQTYIDPVPGTPQQGNPAYPQGLPPYAAATKNMSGQRQVWFSLGGEWVVYVNSISSATINSRVGTISSVTITNVYYEQGDPNNSPTGVDVSWSVTDAIGGNAGGSSSGTAHISNNAGNQPQQGLPAYPQGLPVYVAAVPEVPGYYVDNPGPVSTAVINGNTFTFSGGMGSVPAVTDERRIYANANDGFGSSVAMSKNYLVAAAGSPRDRFQAVLNAGSAFVFRNSANVWSAPIRLAQPSPLANAAFGTSIDLNQNGTVAFVGAPGENKVYVFKNDTYSSTIQVAGLNGLSKFGERVSCSDDGKTVAISSPGEVSGIYQGRVRVYKENLSNVWELVHTLSPSLGFETVNGTVPEGATFRIEQRGVDNVLISTHAIDSAWSLNNATRSIRLIGNGTETIGYLPFGVPNKNNPTYPPGVWAEDSFQIAEMTGLEMFSVLQEDTPETAFSVTYLGNTYSFTRKEEETTYSIDVIRYVGEFGTAISLSEDGSKLAVGAPASRIHVENQGFVSLFTLGAIVNEQRFIGPAPYSGFRYGKSVSLDADGNTMLVTEPVRNANVGSYDVWTLGDNPNNHTRTTSKPNTTTAVGAFGNAAALASNGVTKVFGDPVASNNRGRAYIL